MRRQVMVQEQLAAHEVEGSVVRPPHQQEEPSRVVQTRPGSLIKCIYAAAEGQLVRTHETCEDSEESAGEPPTEWISKEVDLLAGVAVSPEADPTDQKGPLDGKTRIGMRACESTVVIEHGPLQLEVFAQKWH